MESITASVRIQDDGTRERKEGDLPTPTASSGRTREREKKKKKESFPHTGRQVIHLTDRACLPLYPPKFDCCHRHRQTLSGRSFALHRPSLTTPTPLPRLIFTPHTPCLPLPLPTTGPTSTFTPSSLNSPFLRCVALRWSLLCFALPCLALSPHLTLPDTGWLANRLRTLRISTPKRPLFCSSFSLLLLSLSLSTCSSAPSEIQRLFSGSSSFFSFLYQRLCLL